MRAKPLTGNTMMNLMTIMKIHYPLIVNNLTATARNEIKAGYEKSVFFNKPKNDFLVAK